MNEQEDLEYLDQLGALDGQLTIIHQISENAEEFEQNQKEIAKRVDKEVLSDLESRPFTALETQLFSDYSSNVCTLAKA